MLKATSDRYANQCVLCCTIMFLMFSGCEQENSFHCPLTSEREFEHTFRCHLENIKGLVKFSELTVPECISNALSKAEGRKQIGANYRFIPVYCSIREHECFGDAKSDSRDEGFRMEVRSLGDRVARCDLERIWLIAVLESHHTGYCDVVETSLANITHGMGSSWSNFGFGDFWCRCHDPRLGWGDEKLFWNALVANGSCKMYFLLDDGSAWGRRHGRTCCDASKLKLMLDRLNKKGVLIEMTPVAASKQECVMECR